MFFSLIKYGLVELILPSLTPIVSVPAFWTAAPLLLVDLEIIVPPVILTVAPLSLCIAPFWQLVLVDVIVPPDIFITPELASFCTTPLSDVAYVITAEPEILTVPLL